MRVFIAALLPEEIKLSVSDYIDRLKPAVEGVKWDKPEKLHMTLKFLGEVDEATAAEVSNITQGLCSKYSPFKFTTTRLGGFPNLERARVLYLRLSPNEELSALRNEIDSGLGALGFEKENRGFIPHITLARVKNRINIKGALPVPEKIEFDISEIGVIKSELNPKGSVYTPLKVFNLAD